MIIQKKIKPLLPSLRERKRYLAYEIISKEPITDSKAVSETIWKTALKYLGEIGCSEAGIIILSDKFNKKNQRGLIRVNHRSLDRLRATITLIRQVEGQDVIFRSVGASGIIKKAEEKYIAG